MELGGNTMATSTQSLQPIDNVIVPHPVTLELYRKMLTVFYVEERMKTFVRQGKCGFQASTRGHEKLQIGMTMLLKPGHDWFFTYYRSKAVAVGLGMPIKDIFLGMLGREGDPNSNGRNMPEQWSSRKLRLVSQTAVTGTQYLNAVGMARAIKMDGGDEVVHVSSGEGATSEGEFFEALNWASREKLPVLFTVQNNGYAISVPQTSQTGSEVHRIAQGFGMPAFRLDGTWFEHLYETLPPVIDAMRHGAGPALVEAKVVRLDPHSSSDDQRKYRGETELQAITGRDPILQTERYLLRNGVVTDEGVASLRAELKAEVDRAADEADRYPQPDESTVMAHIYSNDAGAAGRRPAAALPFRPGSYHDRRHQPRPAGGNGAQPEDRDVGRRCGRPQRWRVWRDARVEQRLSGSCLQLAAGRGQYCGCSRGYGDRRL